MENGLDRLPHILIGRVLPVAGMRDPASRGTMGCDANRFASLPDRLNERYSIGWMNNWAYAGRFPTEDWQGGSDTIIRSVRLGDDGERTRLFSTPAAELRDLEGEIRVIDDVRVDAGASTELEIPASDAYRLTFEASDADRCGEVRVRITTGEGSFATVGYDFDAQVAFVTRDGDAIAADMPEVYREVRTAVVAPRDGRLKLDIVVDVASIEVFAGEGEASLTMATYGASGDRGLAVEAARGAIEISDATIAPLRVAPVERLPAKD